MANDSVYHSILDEIHTRAHTIQVRVADAAQDMIPEIKDSIFSEFGEYQQKKVEELFRRAVDEFYASYSPAYYERNYSLYDALEFQPDEYGIIDDQIDSNSLFNSSQLTAFRNGDQDGLYNLVFVGGWHGGAAGTDRHGETRTVPSYRVPYSIYSHWGRRAVQTPSPNFLAKQKIHGAEGMMDAEFERISARYADILTERLSKRAEDIVSEVFSDWR